MKSTIKYVALALATLAGAACSNQKQEAQTTTYIEIARRPVATDSTTYDVPALRYRLRRGDSLIRLLKGEHDTDEFYIGDKHVRMKGPGYHWGVKPSAGNYSRELGVRYFFDLFDIISALNPELAKKVEQRAQNWGPMWTVRNEWSNIQRGQEVIFPDIDKDGKINGVKSPVAGTTRFLGSRAGEELIEKKLEFIPKD